MCSLAEAREPTKLPLAGWRGRSPLSSQLFSLSHNKTGGGRVGKKLETRVAAIVAGSILLYWEQEKKLGSRARTPIHGSFGISLWEPGW